MEQCLLPLEILYPLLPKKYLSSISKKVREDNLETFLLYLFEHTDAPKYWKCSQCDTNVLSSKPQCNNNIPLYIFVSIRKKINSNKQIDYCRFTRGNRLECTIGNTFPTYVFRDVKNGYKSRDRISQLTQPIHEFLSIDNSTNREDMCSFLDLSSYFSGTLAITKIVREFGYEETYKILNRVYGNFKQENDRVFTNTLRKYILEKLRRDFYEPSLHPILVYQWMRFNYFYDTEDFFSVLDTPNDWTQHYEENKELCDKQCLEIYNKLNNKLINALPKIE